MNRHLCLAAYAVGALAILWVGVGYAAGHPLALTMTLLIGAFYAMGGLELRRFHQATQGLADAVAALTEPPPSLADWLARLHPSLQTAVRLRVQGERVGLPGPAMTPYLVGLLVLLGMLGTFLGMVVTLNGTVGALEATTDLAAMRASLAAPVKGLGLAFGTSVAGVAASAMLGLVSALCRRARLQAAQALDACIAGLLKPFSLAHQRAEGARHLQQQAELMQQQAQLMPTLVDRLQALMAQMAQQQTAHQAQLAAQHAELQASLVAQQERLLAQTAAHQSEQQARAVAQHAEQQVLVKAQHADQQAQTAAHQAGQQAALAALQARLAEQHQALGTQLAAGQDAFHHQAEARFGALAASVDRTLQHSLTASAQAASATIAPVVEATMAGIAAQTSTLHERMAQAVQQQLDGVASRLDGAVAEVASTWQGALAAHQRSSADQTDATRQALAEVAQGFAQRSDALLAGVARAQADAQAAVAAQDAQRLAAWTAQLATLAETLQRHWAEAGALTLAQQQQVCQTLADTASAISAQAEQHARATVAEVARLIDTAAQAPAAAAEVIGQLRGSLSDSMARDNALLDERSRILAALAGLLDQVQQGSDAQRAAVQDLVASSTTLLERVGAQFGQQLADGVQRLDELAGQVGGGAAEVASLGEAFGQAVALFGAANDKLVAHLQRLETALEKAGTRSDEQLAYVVAQAREVIDLSMLSQRQIVEDLQQLARRPVALAAEPAA